MNEIHVNMLHLGLIIGKNKKLKVVINAIIKGIFLWFEYNFSNNFFLEIIFKKLLK